jgi:hypothetical protein
LIGKLIKIVLENRSEHRARDRVRCGDAKDASTIRDNRKDMSDLQDDAVDSLASTLQSTLSLSPLQSPPTAKPSAQVANSNSTATVLLQPSCLEHRYIRNRDMASIVERPERLKAVCTGVAAALAASLAQTEVTLNQDDDIVKRLEAINLSAVAAPPTLLSSPYIQVLSSTATLDILTHKAVVYVHGDDAYLTQLKGWVSDSEEKIKEGESEIPQGYSQGDLYCTYHLMLP